MGLASILRPESPTSLVVTGRTANVYSSTFASEIVNIENADGEEWTLLVKYIVGLERDAYGHHGRGAYEARVYRELIGSLALGPRLVGVVDRSDEETWLVLEYLSGAVRISRRQDRIPLAAAMLGRFHRDCEDRIADPRLSFLTRYDADYYAGWARRTESFSGPIHHEVPWLSDVCTRFINEAVPRLVGGPTVVHGELSPPNVLAHGDAVVFIDWETAAFGAGEIDLVALTDRWPDDVVESATDAYRKARWPSGDHGDFAARFAAARLYWAFRWLGEVPERTLHPDDRFRFDQLRGVGVDLDLFEPSHR